MACPKPGVRQRLASHDDAALEGDVIAARQTLVAAVTADPVVKVAAAVIAAQVRRSEGAAWASNTATLLGVDSPGSTGRPPRSSTSPRPRARRREQAGEA